MTKKKMTKKKMTKKKIEDDVAVSRKRVERAERDLARAKTALVAAKTAAEDSLAVDAYRRQKERCRKNLRSFRKYHSVRLVRRCLKELADGYEKTSAVIEAHAGRRFLPYKIRGFERKVGRLLNSLKIQLAHLNIAFAAIDPGKIASAVYFPHTHVRIQAYRDRGDYWAQVLEDNSYPWA